MSTEPHPTVKVARDLTEIVKLATDLEDQAVHKASDPLMPGGAAMVALGPVSSTTAYDAALDDAEQAAIAWAYVNGIDPSKVMPETYEDDQEPPLQTLLFWSEAWRTEHEWPIPRRPTISSEAGFIRWALDWAWENEAHWDDFAADVRSARVRLENLLSAGRRPERTRVVCNRCEDSARLIKLYGTSDDGDRWKCPACKARYDADEVRDAYAHQLRSESAAKYVDLPDAIGTLRAQGRPERTIRKWLGPQLEHVADRCTECGEEWEPQEYPACPADTDDGEECGGLLLGVWTGDRDAVIEAVCDISTHRVRVWWPDLWRKHLATQRRVRVEG
jgi:hypothetical protein